METNLNNRLSDSQSVHSSCVKPRPSQQKSYLNQNVSDEELDRVIRQPTLYSETQTINIWRRYIAQMAKSDGKSGQFQEMEHMIRSY